MEVHLYIPKIELGNDAPTWAKQLLESVTTQIATLHVKLSNQIKNITTLSVENSIRIEQLENKNSHLEARLEYMENHFEAIQDRLLLQETDRRRNNLLIHGLPETAWETIEQTDKAVRDFISTKLLIDQDPIIFRKVHRIGRFGKKTIRPILVCFQFPEDQIEVWKSKKKLYENKEEPKVFITQDYPALIQARRRRLMPILKKAKSLDEFRDSSFIRDDKLVIQGTTYTVKTINNLEAPLNPMQLSTIRDGDCIFFWSANSPFSSHHPSVFVIDGVRYNCVEQYYAHQMAICAKDAQKAQAIMATEDPTQHKL